MTGHLTPQAAADRAGVGRTTIMRALEADEIKAVRSNNGRWRITPEAVDDWMSMRPARTVVRESPSSSTDTDDSQKLVDARIEIAALTAERSGLQDRLADAHAERDRLAAALAQALRPHPTWIDRIRGTLTQNR